MLIVQVPLCAMRLIGIKIPIQSTFNSKWVLIATLMSIPTTSTSMTLRAGLPTSKFHLGHFTFCESHLSLTHINCFLFSPGGSYHIQKWSQGWEGHPGWYLIFPFYGNATRKIPVHPMNRWVTKAKEPDIVKVGRLGDNISFRDLLSALKTDAVAE